MEKRNKVEMFSEDININIEGKSDIFGGVDLSVKAAREIIESLDFKFAYETVGMEYSQIAHIQLVSSIGRSIKNLGFYPDEMPNIEVIQHFLNWFIDEAKLHETEKYATLLEEDEEDESITFF
ncbi:hypothetical protein [Paenibacillus macquariensis]|uniref:Uncharacterized protein n=1 Tax=Paenibacillus macquariensis TaxID=948756 RepID=A0ABY1JKE3_9BACL|nr:hypothetical protein [Paenibacillus macquariensis]MEC0089916.1 hypothetical protein [Paenibacillus macquariensis]OAB31193.1 hypothetical protein PMSM_20965 [Paenibacillus macquariensis subsp. macquariensis]SIQ34208.1 hypothetical protein SAMN05421578_101302 [Paenibacillus macquariensis]